MPDRDRTGTVRLTSGCARHYTTDTAEGAGVEPARLIARPLSKRVPSPSRVALPRNRHTSLIPIKRSSEDFFTTKAQIHKEIPFVEGTIVPELTGVSSADVSEEFRKTSPMSPLMTANGPGGTRTLALPHVMGMSSPLDDGTDGLAQRGAGQTLCSRPERSATRYCGVTPPAFPGAWEGVSEAA